MGKQKQSSPPGTPSRTLPTNGAATVHLWYARPGTGAFTILPDRPEESVEHGTGRALVGWALSQLTGVAPTDWRFRKGDHGRPEIEGPAEAKELRFSLSHTRGLVVCLAAWNRQVGVDAERIRHDDSLLEVVDRCFDPTEAAALRALPGTERCVRLLEHWTLKEAYAKARGLGLALPLNRVAFELAGDPAGGIRAAFAPELDDSPSAWQFGLHGISGEHVVATAVEQTTGSPPPVIRIREATSGHPTVL